MLYHHLLCPLSAQSQPQALQHPAAAARVQNGRRPEGSKCSCTLWFCQQPSQELIQVTCGKWSSCNAADRDVMPTLVTSLSRWRQDVLWLGHPNTTSIWSVQFFHYTINEEVELLEMLENTVGTKNISLLIAIVYNFLCGKTQIVWHLGNHFTCLHQLQSLLKGSFANCSDIKHYCVHVHTSVRIYSKS